MLTLIQCKKSNFIYKLNLFENNNEEQYVIDMLIDFFSKFIIKAFSGDDYKSFFFFNYYFILF